MIARIRQPIIIRPRAAPPAAPNVAPPRPIVARVEEWPSYPGSVIALRGAMTKPPSVAPPRPAMAHVEEWPPYPGAVLLLRGLAPSGSGHVYNLSVSAGLGIQPAIVPSLGRFRWGDIVPLSFVPPATPAAAPTLTLKDSSGDTLATVSLYSKDGGITFRADVLATQLMGIGTVTAEWVATTATGAGYLQMVQFDVVAGGDPGGDVISLYASEGPAGRYVIAQLVAGRLVMGKNPWIEPDAGS